MSAAHVPPLVLVIDDDEDSRDAFAYFLSAAGLGVRTVGSGTDGLAVAREASPDVVVLDLGLPDLDGWEVTRRLRADPATRGARIIALTGHTTGEAWQRALDAGVDAYLLKPCAPEDLVAEVRKRIPPA